MLAQLSLASTDAPNGSSDALGRWTVVDLRWLLRGAVVNSVLAHAGSDNTSLALTMLAAGRMYEEQQRGPHCQLRDCESAFGDKLLNRREETWEHSGNFVWLHQPGQKAYDLVAVRLHVTDDSRQLNALVLNNTMNAPILTIL